MSARIADILSDSPADMAGLRAGETIIGINGIEINDYLDYMYASCSEEAEVELENRTVVIENYDFEPLGILFDTLLIDEPKSCRNKCIFCFIDQLPKGMRETCYFKDDDYRLSFLQGNYVSMTNMSDEDVDRILKYSIPRINISVHTTNPELRKKMLNNKNAGKIMDYLKRLADGGLNINAQIVLCPGYNDGEELERSISDLASLGESVESVSVVPVGLSDHREGLAELRGFDKDSAAVVIQTVEKWQNKLKKERGTNLIYLGDEFYLTAGQPFPDYWDYDGFPQIENGVGLCTSLIYEFDEALAEAENKLPKSRKTVAVGYAAYSVIKSLADKLEGDMIDVIPIKNNFFGSKITVTGLLTGKDIIEQLKDRELGDTLLLSTAMLRHDEEVLLDDTRICDIEQALNIRIETVSNDGYELFDALMR